MYAAELGDYKAVEAIINKGVNPDTYDKVNLQSK